MSSYEDKDSRSGATASKKRRRHDSEASRKALLEAGGAVFDEVGYDRATTREIGERAGVDPALIARYFGSKEGLFLAAIAAGEADDAPFPIEPRELLAFLFERWDRRGHNPISRALASPSPSGEVREQVAALVAERMEPQIEALRRRGVSSPELRMELLVAIAVGIAMTRANRMLETLSKARRDEILELLESFIDSFRSG